MTRATHGIEDVFGNRSRVLVLRALAGVSVPLNGSRIARSTGLSKPAVAEALARLESMGLVKSHPLGRATAHWLDRDNLYVQEIVLPAFRFESELPDMLEDDLRAWFGADAVSIVLFGSYARGEQAETSDVDVLLVGTDDAAKRRLEAASHSRLCEFHGKYGVPLSPLVYDPEEASELFERAPALFEAVVRDAVVVSGLRPEEWRSHAGKR